MISVIIIEDNKYMREGWQTFINFENDMEVLATYDSCEKAFNESQLSKASIVLMDIGLPGMSGIEGVKYLKEKYPQISIIMATVYDDDKHIFQALEAGANGYLMKKTTPEELIKAIRDVDNGGSTLTPNVAKKVLDTLYNPKKIATDIGLSDRELQILQELAKGKSYAAVGRTIFLSEDGVRFHIRNIYRKLQVNSKAEAVSKGIQKGLI